MRFVLANVVIEVLQPWAIELSDLFEAFLEFKQFEFWEILVEILGNGAACRPEDGVPASAIVVTRKRDLIHDEGILHRDYNYFG